MARVSNYRRISAKRCDELNEFRRDAPEVMDLSGAAQYLGVSERYLQENAESLKIPFREIGRTKLFSKRSLIDWVEGYDWIDPNRPQKESCGE